MYSLLLALIYLSFISLGLPDSLIGAAWPVMSVDLGASLSAAGIITTIISLGTIVSSAFSNTLINKLGTGLLTAISVLFTAIGLIGFSFASAFWMLVVFAIPYGLGAGAVDAALNNYTAINYPARHFNWLHCMWGVGASVSPYIMSYALTGGLGWGSGFRIVFYVQIALVVVLFATLPVWKRVEKDRLLKAGESLEKIDEKKEKVSTRKVLKISGVMLAFVAFFAYCAMEQTAGLWATTYLVQYKGIDAIIAAKFGSFFYIGITVGRAIAGIFADKVGDKTLIRGGAAIILLGILLIALPVENRAVALSGLVVIGFGCAPIYPAILHSMPGHFGKENSQAIMGVQMAFGYTAIVVMPPVFGLIAEHVSVGLYWVYLLVFAMIMLAMSEMLNGKMKKKFAIKADEYVKQ